MCHFLCCIERKPAPLLAIPPHKFFTLVQIYAYIPSAQTTTFRECFANDYYTQSKYFECKQIRISQTTSENPPQNGHHNIPFKTKGIHLHTHASYNNTPGLTVGCSDLDYYLYSENVHISHSIHMSQQCTSNLHMLIKHHFV